MSLKSTNKVEDQLLDSLSIVELEERHEMTAAAAELGRCNSNSGTVDSGGEEAPAETTETISQ